MNKNIEQFILNQTAARSVDGGELVQPLWSGYGEVRRVYLSGAELPSAIVKQVVIPSAFHHPRGWHSDFSHQRKLLSYQIETAWYQHWAEQCDQRCRISRCYGVQKTEQGMLLLLEDLDATGWDQRYQNLTLIELKQCLRWLAAFHGRFLFEEPIHLWPVGSYWHLATRPDEWQAMADQPLKKWAKLIDEKLNQASFKTIIHGDAKAANFCFSKAFDDVAAVDFQYVGGGCGIKDVAYLLGSCLQQAQIDEHQELLLDFYFEALIQACAPSVNHQALEAEWRYLYPFAWADFHRFLKGWSPEHWKLNSYSERITQQVIDALCR